MIERHVGDMLAYVCPWHGRWSLWYLGTTVSVSARSALGAGLKLVRDWLGIWSSWYLCTFVGVTDWSALGVDPGKWSSWYAGTSINVPVWLISGVVGDWFGTLISWYLCAFVDVSARSTLGVDLKLVGAWFGTSISWYLGTSVDVTAWSAFDLQQHRASWVLLVLLRYTALYNIHWMSLRCVSYWIIRLLKGTN